MKADVDKEQDLRIIELRVANYMRLHAVRIRPTGTVVEITGKNEAGKTSTIGSIAWALGGKEFAEAMPLRKGETDGEVFVDLGALRVTKHMRRRADGEVDVRLVVEFANGSRPKSPQLVLDELRGMLLDPIGFIHGNGAARIKMVQGLIPEFDFAENARRRKEAYDERTDVNRDHKRAVMARDAISLPAGEKPEAVDVTKLLSIQQAAIEHNALVDTKSRNRSNAERDIEQLRDEADSLRARARDLDTEADALEKRLANAGPLPEKVDLAPIREQLMNAQVINARRALFEDHERKHNEALRLSNRSKSLTEKIEAFDVEKAEVINGIKLPFKGLAIGEEDVELDGVPFDQVAFSTRLRAAAALTMASEPRLRVMLVREYGSLLDADSKKLLAGLAEEQGWQVWMETVSEGGPGKILIEDGEGRVKKIDDGQCMDRQG